MKSNRWRVLARRFDPAGIRDPSVPLPAWARLMYRMRRPLGLVRIRRAGRLADLKALGRTTSRARKNDGSPKIAVVELIGSPLAGASASVLAHALRLRGCDVMMYTCGGGQPICSVGWSRLRHPLPCDRCGAYARDVARAGRFPLSELRDAFPWGPDGRRAPTSLEPRAGSAVDYHRVARVGATQWHRATDFMSVASGSRILQDFAVSAAGVEEAVATCIERDRPDTLLVRDGYYTAEHALLQTARSMGVHVVSHSCIYRAPARFFTHNQPSALMHTDEAWRSSEARSLSDAEKTVIDDYLREREQGHGTFKGSFTDPLRGSDAVRDYLRFPEGTRLISLFPNITWDIACIGRDVGFSSMLEWIDFAIAAVARDERTALVVRSHPGEARSKSRERIVNAVGPKLEGHPRMRLLAPDEPVDTYSLIDASDLVLTYTSMVGLEAAIRGATVAVAGDVHYRGKGFTHDVATPSQLEPMISGAPSPPVDAAALAQAYAYMFFFRLRIPLPGFEFAPGVELWAKNPVHRIPEVSELMPGGNPYLDFVCDKILTREPFLLPSDLALTAARAA